MEYHDIDEKDRELIAAAAEVIRRNFCQDRHKVGAVVHCASGRTYVGVNVDSCGYGPCAEPIAVGAAISAGERDIRTVVAVEGRSGQYRVISPCGNCRQLLLDFAPCAEVILEQGGHTVKAAVRNLLPEPYRSF
jgi:cytidine deaminase